jgi:hypothetical protein
MAMQLKAFHVDDMTIFAAEDAAQAAALYLEETGEVCDAPDYPQELTDEELDREIAEFDANERRTGRTTTIRSWLPDAKRGFLAGTE